MASVEKPTFTQPVPRQAEVLADGDHLFACWTDRKGQPVRALILPTGKCRRTVPGRWVGVYRDHRGVKQKTPTFGNRSAALRAALDGERAAAAVRDGRARPGISGGKAFLLDHVDAYLEHLTLKGTGAGQRASVEKQLVRIIRDHGLTTPGAVDGERLAAGLERDRVSRRGRARPGEPLSLRSRNMWTITLRSFGNWLAATGRAAANPFTGLPVVNAQADRRRVRRALPV
jgi:hypothetical protein